MSEKTASSETIKVIKDEKGRILARVFEEDGILHVYRTTCCSIGTYFEILSYLNDLGHKAI